MLREISIQSKNNDNGFRFCDKYILKWWRKVRQRNPHKTQKDTVASGLMLPPVVSWCQYSNTVHCHCSDGNISNILKRFLLKTIKRTQRHRCPVHHVSISFYLHVGRFCKKTLFFFSLNFNNRNKTWPFILREKRSEVWQVSVRNRPEERQTFAKRRKLKRKESIVNRKTAKKKIF